MREVLKVFLWGQEICRLSWHDARKTTFFVYNPEFLKGTLDIAPLAASYFLSPSDICGYFRLEFPNILLYRLQLDAISLWILVFWYCSIYRLLLCRIMWPVLLLSP